MSNPTDAVEANVIEDFVLEANPFNGARALLFAVPAERRLFDVEPEERLFAVAPERRLFSILPDLR